MKQTLDNTILVKLKVFLFVLMAAIATYSGNSEAAANSIAIGELEQLYLDSSGSEKVELSLRLAARVEELNSADPLAKFKEYLASATSASQSTGDDGFHTDTLFEAGQLAWRSGVPSVALDYYDDALKLAKKINSDKFPEIAFYWGVIYFENSEFTKATGKLDICIQESLRRNLLNLLPRCSNLQGNIYNKLGQPTKAIPLLKRALAIESKNKNLRALAAITNNLGLSYSKTGAPEKAIEYYLRSFDMELQQGNLDGKIISLMNISTIYFNDMRDVDTGFNYINRAISLAEASQVKDSLPILYVNIANFYQDELRFGESKAMYLKAIGVSEEINDKQSSVRAYIGLGRMGLSEKQYEKSLEHFQAALDGAKAAQSQEEKIVANIGIAEALIFMERSQEALPYLKSASIDAKKHKLIDHEGNAIRVISNAYAKIKDFEKAYNYLKEYSLFITKKNEERLKKDIAKVKAKFEVEKNEVETILNRKDRTKKNIESLVERKVRSWLYAVLGILALVLLLLLKGNNRTS